MRSRLSGTVCVAVLLVTACRDDGSLNGQVLAWPPRAMGGDTVSIGIETNLIDHEPYKKFDLSTENLEIRLEEVGQPANAITIPPKAIVSAMADPSAQLDRDEPGVELQVAVFDIPDGSIVSLPFSGYPVMVRVVPMREGQPLNDGVVATFAVLELEAATGGQPTTFWPPHGLQDLEPLPSLRLRPLWVSGGQLRFAPSWTIGSIQFDLTYPATIQNISAVGKGRAAHNTVVVRNIGSQTVRVLLVAPDGFQLPVPLSGFALGLGPLIDIVFDKIGGFDEGEFTITNLLVTDPDGNLLAEEPGDARPYFAMIPRRNDP